jgi:hypothetical protein
MYKCNPGIIDEETSTATRSTGDRLARPWLTEQKSHMSPYGCMCVCKCIDILYLDVQVSV